MEIIQGEWKGYKGRVKNAYDRQVIIELSSKCKQIPIERSLVQVIEGKKDMIGTTRGDDMSYGG